MKEFNIQTFNKHRRNDPSNTQEIKIMKLLVNILKIIEGKSVQCTK